MLIQLTLAAALATALSTVAVMAASGARVRAIAATLASCDGLLLAAVVFRTPAVIALLVVPVTALIATHGNAWHAWSRWNMALLTQATVLGAVTVGAQQFGHLGGFGIGLVVSTVAFGLQSLAVALGISFAFEVHDVLGRSRFPVLAATVGTPAPARWPGVCIQVPAHDEPPEMLAQTIRQLMEQDYPGRWMVQVIDNNTADPATWLPIANLCAALGERVQFLHLSNWPGYKSGALNEGLRRLPAWAEVIAVVDADYHVEPGFLRATARHFADARVGFVQTPQHYRAWERNRYTRGLFHSYRYFFDVSMLSRNEHGAIIFGGTMGLIRRIALERLGGWDQWCITEDAETSLRLLSLGYRGVYDPHPYGAGLMPFSFDALKKQRFRWAFGGVQILKRHLGLMTGRTPSHLTRAQRFIYLTSALQWFSDVLTVAFVGILALGGGVLLVSGHTWGAGVDDIMLVAPALLVLSGLMRSIWALRLQAGCTAGDAVRALLVWFGLSWTVARACAEALRRPSGVFMRTPKAEGDAAWRRALAAIHTEARLALFCADLGGLVLAVRHGAPGALLYGGFLLFLAAVYGSSVLCALWSEGITLSPSALFRAAVRRSVHTRIGAPRFRTAA